MQHDQMERYSRWCREGYLSSTGNALILAIQLWERCRFKKQGEPYSGLTNPNTAGNGSDHAIGPCYFVLFILT